MKLTQFALAAIIVLLAVAGYLTMKSDLDSRLEAQNVINDKILARVEDLAKKQAQPAAVAPAPVAAPVAPPAVSAPVPRAPKDPAALAALAAASAIPPDAPLAADNDPRMMEDEQKTLNAGAESLESLDPVPAPTGPSLSKVQQQIVSKPAIAKVKEYATKEGMLVLDKGTNVGLKAGDPFSLRRKSAVIGKIRISETIQEDQAVADIVPGSMPVGMEPAAGDEVIQFEQ